MELNKVYNIDALAGLKKLADASIDCIVTSPPYWQLRDYGHDDQIGLEPDFHDYIDKLVEIFMECHRVLKKTGTMFINISDTYNGDKKAFTDQKRKYLDGNAAIHKPMMKTLSRKTLLNIPSRLAIALTESGWTLRNEIIWEKTNAMPESVKDRFTVDYEKIYFFVKSRFYYFEQVKEKMRTVDLNSPRGSVAQIKQLNKGLRLARQYDRSVSSMKENIHPVEELKVQSDYMRNKRCVWSIPTEASSYEHFAMFPYELASTLISAGCPEHGVVLDPFIGSGTTAIVAKHLNRNFIGFEINPKFIEIAKDRINGITPSGQTSILDTDFESLN